MAFDSLCNKLAKLLETLEETDKDLASIYLALSNYTAENLSTADEKAKS